MEAVTISSNAGFFRLLAQQYARISRIVAEHRQWNGWHAVQVQRFFGEFLPRYLFALEQRHLHGQFTVSYYAIMRKPPSETPSAHPAAPAPVHG